ncbi:ATP-binding protein [Sanguibacter sp. 4.1]|uniref:histidine kinase n=1 Tax=Sanguibacter biliveldensis TaxID=3030830 RepID=A0AAF0Z2P0_9MICO|nr:ATP-binding protein [Sanguibacter sp. 4.1]WPF81893.1 ATP-binding protein [Sanguibacter sp. 4.1]
MSAVPAADDRGHAQSRRRPWTLRRQLVALLIGLVLLICSILAVVSTLSLRSELVGQIEDDLRQASSRAVDRPLKDLGGSSTPPASGCPDGGDCSAADPGQAPSQYQVPGQGAGDIDVLLSGSTVVHAGYVDESGDFRSLVGTDALATLEALATDGRIHEVDLGDLGSFLAISTTTPSGDTVVTAVSTAPADDPLRSYVAVEVALIVLAVLLAAAAATVLVRRALRPLERVAGAALRVSELQLDRGEVEQIHGVDPQDTDERTEVGTVGAALNRMLGHVESSLAARHESETQVRQFVADASHELRTPLASIRGYAELVRRSPDDVPVDTLRALDRIESEALRMGALVEDLLLLARLDAGRPLEREEVDLTLLAVDALADAHAASHDHVWELDLLSTERTGSTGSAESTGSTDSPGSTDGTEGTDDADDDAPAPDVVVRGDEARLRQVFVNLLSNARVHTPPGTRVVLGLRAEPGTVVVSVTDDGPGIAPALLPSLFQRFSRGDSARNRVGGSTGLGLAIAQAIVQEHGGTLTAHSPAQPLGGGPGTGPRGTGEASCGATFEVRLPRSG